MALSTVVSISVGLYWIVCPLGLPFHCVRLFAWKINFPINPRVSVCVRRRRLVGQVGLSILKVTIPTHLLERLYRREATSTDSFVRPSVPYLPELSSAKTVRARRAHVVAPWSTNLISIYSYFQRGYYVGDSTTMNVNRSPTRLSI